MAKQVKKNDTVTRDCEVTTPNDRKAGSSGRKKQYTKRSHQSKSRSTDKAMGTNHKYNDVSWYAKNQYMLRDAASLPFSYRLGDVIYHDTMETYIKAPALYSDHNLSYQGIGSIPGLMRFKFVPCIGISKDSSSPANLAAQNIYSYVRYMNSGAKNYDQADLMIYLLAMDSIYMLWNWLKRMYGYLRTYSVRNAYMPRAFANGDNLNFDNAIANLADIRMQLNSLAAQISSFCVPAVMPLFIRHSWLVSNLYKDSDTEKAQMYMLSPDIYYQYDETGSRFGGQLVAKGTSLDTNSANGMSYYITLLKNALDAIAYSEDIGVMSGDILKAYGQDKLFKISPLEPDYMVEPVYNEEVLNQLHNMTIIQYAGTYKEEGSTLGDLNITQDPDTGFLRYDPNFIGTTTEPVLLPGSKAMINMPWDNVTPENVMVGTRLTCTMSYHPTSSGQQVYHLTAVGSEFISGATIVYFTSAGQLARNSFTKFIDIGLGDGVIDVINISQFDWHPLTTIMNIGSEVIRVYGLMGDINNYTYVEDTVLSKLHQTALLSEFNVPQIGSF